MSAQIPGGAYVIVSIYDYSYQIPGHQYIVGAPGNAVGGTAQQSRYYYVS